MDTVMISIDSSTSNTGCAVWKNGKLSEYFLIESRYKVVKNMTSLDYMVSELYRLIDKYDPQIVVAELTVVVRNPQVQRDLSMLLGALMGKCISKDIFWFTFRPTEWRSLVKDKNETLPKKRIDLKTWACEKVLNEYNITETDDVCEAILIGQAYINKFNK